MSNRPLAVALARLRQFAAPPGVTAEQRRNFINVQVDAVGVGLAAAASPFLPVFLTRLGATNFEVGLLTAMPAATGLLLGVLVGRFLQSKRQIVPWFSVARFVVLSGYALTGLAPALFPQALYVPAILGIWAAITVPQIMVNVAFSVVMSAVAGPAHRYDLMSRRWSILGLTTALMVVIAGQVLERMPFPLNYQVVFMVLSSGGLISLIFSSRIRLPDAPPPAPPAPGRLWQRLQGYVREVRAYPDYVAFTAKRFVFLSGVALAAPLFPLYYVREAHAPEAWIGLISTTQTFVVVFGYFVWTRASRRRGSRFVLFWATLGLALYPALAAMTREVAMLALLAGVGGIFQAGIDLVFFDELMKTVPPERAATFVSLAQSLQHLSGVASPLIGTVLSDHIGLGGGLLVSAGLRLAGWALFAFVGRR